MPKNDGKKPLLERVGRPSTGVPSTGVVDNTPEGSDTEGGEPCPSSGFYAVSAD